MPYLSRQSRPVIYRIFAIDGALSGGADFYIDVEASLAMGENFSLFGAVRYDAFSDFYYEVGISVVF